MNAGLGQFTGMVNQRNSPIGIFTPAQPFPGFFARVYAEHSGSNSHSHSTSGSYMPFRWEEVRPLPAGEWETWATARTGGEDTFNEAYEFNDADVADGSVVWLWYGDNYVNAAGQQVWDMRFVAGEADGAGSGSGSGGGGGGCECPDICEAIVVPDGSTYTTKYLRFENCCLTVSDEPCLPSTECNECLNGVALRYDATGLAAFGGGGYVTLDSQSTPALDSIGSLSALPGGPDCVINYTLGGVACGETVELSVAVEGPMALSDPEALGNFGVYLSCFGQGAEICDPPGVLRAWLWLSGPGEFDCILEELTLTEISCDPLSLTFVGPFGETVVFTPSA